MVANNIEALVDIPSNRTIVAARLTAEESVRPEMVYGLQTLRQVFDYYGPSVSFRFEDAEGRTKTEELRFRAIEDFSIEGIKLQSTTIKDLENRREQFFEIAKQIKTDQGLQQILKNADKRRSFEQLITALVNELKT